MVAKAFEFGSVMNEIDRLINELSGVANRARDFYDGRSVLSSTSIRRFYDDILMAKQSSRVAAHIIDNAFITFENSEADRALLLKKQALNASKWAEVSQVSKVIFSWVNQVDSMISYRPTAERLGSHLGAPSDFNPLLHTTVGI